MFLLNYHLEGVSLGDEDYGGALEWIIFYYLKEEKTKIKGLLNSVSLYAFDDTFVPLFLPACLHLSLKMSNSVAFVDFFLNPLTPVSD